MNHIRPGINQRPGIIIDNDNYAVPFDKIMEAIDFCEYGSVMRVMLQMLFITGCRCDELQYM